MIKQGFGWFIWTHGSPGLPEWTTGWAVWGMATWWAAQRRHWWHWWRPDSGFPGSRRSQSSTGGQDRHPVRETRHDQTQHERERSMATDCHSIFIHMLGRNHVINWNLIRNSNLNAKKKKKSYYVEFTMASKTECCGLHKRSLKSVAEFQA